MKSKVFITLILLANISLKSFSQQKKIDVTYIANAGFMLATNNEQLAIDALFKHVIPQFVAPPDSVATKIINGQKPFDKLHLLLVTHSHADHFNDSMVVAYLNHDPENILMAPSLVINAVLKYPDFKGNKDQIVGLYKEDHYRKDTTIQGIRIQSFFLQHDNRPEIENVGYLIDMDGIKILHVGDDTGNDSLRIENLQLQNKNIDLAFLGSFWLNSDRRELAKNVINPQKIVLMHVPIKYHEMIKEGVNKVNKTNNYVNITIFDNSMDKKTFVFNQDQKP